MTLPRVLYGQPAAEHVKTRAREILEGCKTQAELHVIMVGHNPSSASYIQAKQRAARELGMGFSLHAFPETVSKEEIQDTIDGLNADPKVSGILLQLPLPHAQDANALLEAISPSKDVDGFHPINVGRLWTGQEGLFPCTAVGIVEMCHFYGISLSRKEVVIVGRSNIVGKPLAGLMLREGATVTVTHSQTRDLKAHTQQADIVVVAVGQPNLLTSDMVQNGVTVIDVGINRDEDQRLVGDVDPNVYSKVSAYTPVPKGVGPLTVAHLMLNTALAHQKKEKP